MSQIIEVETISEACKKSLNAILNQAVQTEYDIVLNYPKLIDQFANSEKFNDEKLISDLETIGRDSVRHLGWVMDLLKSLGGEPVWQLNTVERYYNVQERKGQQLEKEKAAAELYKKAISLVRGNVVKEKVEIISGRLIKRKGKSEEEVRKVSELVSILERIYYDEEKHVKMIQGMLATYDFLSGES